MWQNLCSDSTVHILSQTCTWRNPESLSTSLHSQMHTRNITHHTSNRSRRTTQRNTPHEPYQNQDLSWLMVWKNIRLTKLLRIEKLVEDTTVQFQGRGPELTKGGSQAASWKTTKRSTFTGKVSFSVLLASLMPAVAFPTRSQVTGGTGSD